MKALWYTPLPGIAGEIRHCAVSSLTDPKLEEFHRKRNSGRKTNRSQRLSDRLAAEAITELEAVVDDLREMLILLEKEDAIGAEAAVSA
jgi:hypothetical protein